MTSPETCCLCGLLCPNAMRWPDNDQPPDCQRLHAWLNAQDGAPLGLLNQTSSAGDDRLAEAAQRLAVARRPLIWLESADVDTARAAFLLAQACGATLTVAQSPGAHHIAAMTGTHGTLGTSLAELHQSATLIVHVGDQHLRDMPMLTPRFLATSSTSASSLGPVNHLFLDRCPASWLSSPAMVTDQLEWTPDQWLDRLTRTLLALRDDSAAMHRPADRTDFADESAAQLAEYLLASRYTVIIWHEEQFSDQRDRLVLERLWELSQQISLTTRCTLLPLASDPGRTTAKDALLWLTNRTGPIRFCNGQWQNADVDSGASLEEWQQAHDWILGVRSLPSDRQLPDLQFDLLLDAWCNVSTGSSTARDQAPLPVAALGLDRSGFVMRNDHGLVVHARAATAPAAPMHTAAQAMDELKRCLAVAKESTC
ncbi:MAG: hypothetical protein IT423_02240 [Pirellulaceae bacterium]|nr:hypothetical protein [Pirellulaceae bacterium]